MLSVDQINNLESENKKLKYVLKLIWNIAEHQINFNVNNIDIDYTVKDLKKIQEKINEVLK